MERFDGWAAVRRRARDALAEVVSLVFPDACAGCGQPDAPLCDRCRFEQKLGGDVARKIMTGEIVLFRLERLDERLFSLGFLASWHDLTSVT